MTSKLQPLSRSRARAGVASRPLPSPSRLRPQIPGEEGWLGSGSDRDTPARGSRRTAALSFDTASIPSTFRAGAARGSGGPRRPAPRGEEEAGGRIVRSLSAWERTPNGGQELAPSGAVSRCSRAAKEKGRPWKTKRERLRPQRLSQAGLSVRLRVAIETRPSGPSIPPREATSARLLG